VGGGRGATHRLARHRVAAANAFAVSALDISRGLHRTTLLPKTPTRLGALNILVYNARLANRMLNI